jgi:hypothetical protein
MRNKGGATGLYNDGNVQGVLNYSSNGAAVIGIDAVGTRTAIGIATANLDTQLAAVAKTGADGDTLETLSVQLDAIVPLTAQETRDAMKLAPTAGTPDADSIDEHLDDILEDTGTTIPATLATLATAADLATVDANVDAIKMITDDLDTTAVTQVAASSAGHLVITAGLTFEESVSGLVIPADWTKAYWTLKSNEADADTLATIQLRVSNPSSLTDGLQRLNGAALVTPITAASGALTVDQLNGRITINLADEVTILLSRAGSVKSKIGALGWDVKFISSGSSESVGRRGTAAIVLTETKAIL